MLTVPYIRAGPGVFSLKSYNEPHVKAWAQGPHTGAYASMVTAHWYAARGVLPTSNVKTFLDEKKVRCCAEARFNGDVVRWERRGVPRHA